jgi:cell wall-associated NlpC family hydrolase
VSNRLFRHARNTVITRTVASMAVAGGVVVGMSVPAQAHPVVAFTAAAPASSSVVQAAERLVGTPYVRGGTTPAGFDCSGFTGYVFSQVGVQLPRTSNDQLNASQRVSAADARPGDLVFYTSAGRAYHVGIYAGGGMMYDSPKPGKGVSKRAMWPGSIVYGRVLH